MVGERASPSAWHIAGNNRPRRSPQSMVMFTFWPSHLFTLYATLQKALWMTDRIALVSGIATLVTHMLQRLMCHHPGQCMSRSRPALDVGSPGGEGHQQCPGV